MRLRPRRIEKYDPWHQQKTFDLDLKKNSGVLEKSHKNQRDCCCSRFRVETRVRGLVILIRKGENLNGTTYSI